jgi:YD repeat-containing protein
LGRVISTTSRAEDIFTGQTVTLTTKVYYDAAGNKAKKVDANGGVSILTPPEAGCSPKKIK